MLHQQISELAVLTGIIISSADTVEMLLLMKLGTSGRALLAEGVWFSPAVTYPGNSPVHLGRTYRASALQASLAWA